MTWEWLASSLRPLRSTQALKLSARAIASICLWTKSCTSATRPCSPKQQRSSSSNAAMTDSAAFLPCHVDLRSYVKNGDQRNAHVESNTHAQKGSSGSICSCLYAKQVEGAAHAERVDAQQVCKCLSMHREQTSCVPCVK